MAPGHMYAVTVEVLSRALNKLFACLLITFCVSRRRRKMYCGHARLCVCLSVRGHMPTLLHGPECNLGDVRDAPSCALLGGFAIGARVALL